MIPCIACNKTYKNKYNLIKHHKRQPLCSEWVKLKPGIKDYINEKFLVPIDTTEGVLGENTTRCVTCGVEFANVGNFNRHYETSTICQKWSMLETYSDFMEKYEAFIAPKYSLCHIIWNLFMIDKDLPITEEMIKDNNIKYIIGILPDENIYNEKFKDHNIDHHIMLYEDHNMNLDITVFDEQCIKIEEYRKDRGNIFLFCNNGYQRSIPFLCYYLVKYHTNEAPDIAKAIDLILPQVDKNNYANIRDAYIESMTLLLKKYID